MTQRVVQLFHNVGEALRTLLGATGEALVEAVSETGLGDCCCSCADLNYPECLHCVDTEEFVVSEGEVSWPVGVTEASLECWGRGGGGGDSLASGEGAGGGGGGAYARVVRVTKGGDSLSVLVNDPTNSFRSEVWDGTELLCRAAPGADGADSPHGEGGLGGAREDCVGEVLFPGGKGANGKDTSGVISGMGGAGGGGAGSSQAGAGGDRIYPGVGGKALGGDGGEGSPGISSPDPDGQDYGGGGAGGFGGNSGGNPGRGLVRVHWWTADRSLSLVLSGLPTGSYECPCPADGGYHAKTIDWGEVNGSYVLDMDVSFLGRFIYHTVPDSSTPDELRAGAPLVEFHQEGTCDELPSQFEVEYRLKTITVVLDCREPGEMYIQGITITLWGVQRARFTGGDWTEWSYIEAKDIPNCGYGEPSKVVPACTHGQMQRSFLAPDLHVVGDCPSRRLVMTCDDTELTTTSVQIVAVLNPCGS